MQHRVPWAMAGVAGLAWGLAPADGFGALCTLGGALAFGQMLGPRRLTNAARGAVVGVIWFALQLRWLPPALSAFSPGWGPPLTLLLVLLQALAPAAIAFGSRWGDPWRTGLAAIAVHGLFSEVLPLPAGPAMLLAGAPVLLGPAWFGAPVLSGVLLGWGTLSPRPAVVALGMWALISPCLPTGGPASIVGVVQPGFGAYDGRRASTASARARKLVDAIPRDADWVATPEGVWPFDPGAEPGHHRDELAKALAGLPPLALGATVDWKHPTNSVIAVTSGAVLDRFDKHGLVPGAERQWHGIGRDRYSPGEGARRLTIAGVPIAPLICYEDIDPQALREAEGDIIFAPSSDVWLGSQGARDHLAAARIAAVQLHRWVVRPTTNGVSAVIDPAGRLVWAAAWVDGDRYPNAPARVWTGEVPRRSVGWDGADAALPLAVLAFLARLWLR